MRSLLTDLHYAFRRLPGRAGLTVAIVLTISLGVGATTAIYSLIDAILLSPLPYPDSERIVLISETAPDGSRSAVSRPGFEDLAARCRSIERFAALESDKAVLTGDAPAELVNLGRVSEGFFDVIGVHPAVGRGFRHEDRNVVILSDESWTRLFARDPDIVGRGIILTGSPFTVVGVMPAGFRFFRKTDAFVPFLRAEDGGRDERTLLVLGRRAPGVPVEQARVEAESILRTPAGWGGTAESLQDVLVRGPRSDLPVLLAAAVALLLIACANVAGLLLADGGGRGHEMAVRASLGAGRGRLIRQLLAESVVTAAAAGMFGAVLAAWAISVLRVQVATVLPASAAPVLNFRVLCFAATVSVAAGIVFGITPALRASRVDLVDGLKQGARLRSSSRTRPRLRTVLVAGELAACVVLVSAAGLMVRALSSASRWDARFDPDRILTLRVSLIQAKYADPDRAAVFLSELLTKTGGMPGVRSSAITTALPRRDWTNYRHFEIAGQPASSPSRSAQFVAVSPGFFGIMGIRLARGRGFTETDMRLASEVAVVNQAFVRRFLPGADALESRIVPLPRDPGSLPLQIVGIVGDQEAAGPASQEPPLVFVPYRRQPAPEYSVLILSDSNDGTTLAGAAATTIRSVDPDVPVSEVQTYSRIRDRSFLIPRILVGSMTVLGSVALLLAIIGTYGLVSHSVTQRGREIGIRSALGATRADLVRLIMRESAGLILIGTASGLLATAAAAKLLRGLLFGVPAEGLATGISVAAILAATTLIASYVPARRVLRIDPAEVLRC